jgi:hypothetical protein
MGKRSLNNERLLRCHQRIILQKATKGFDLLRRPVGKIREGAFANLLALPPGFPKKDGRRGVAIGNTLYVHGYTYIS